MVNGNIYELRVKTVNKQTRKIEGKILDVREDVLIPFAENKEYDDYKHMRRELIFVRYINNAYVIVEK